VAVRALVILAQARADKAVTPILRQGDYPLVPEELKLLHGEDSGTTSSMPFICGTSVPRSPRWLLGSLSRI
jgi:hypothetical protein